MGNADDTSTGSQGASGLEFNEARYGKVHVWGDEMVDDDRLGLVLRLVESSGAKSILDVGCTDGFASRMFKRMGLHTVGVDASPGAVESAKAYCDEAYVCMLGSQALPIPDNHVDMIWAGEIIEHIFDTESFVEEMLRVLKPGGRMVLSTPNLAAWLNRISLLIGRQPFFSEVGVRHSNHGNFLRKASDPAGHIRNFTPSSLRHLLTQCGWKVEAMRGASIVYDKRVQWLDKFLSHALPGLATDMVFICRK